MRVKEPLSAHKEFQCFGIDVNLAKKTLRMVITSLLAWASTYARSVGHHLNHDSLIQTHYS